MQSNKLDEIIDFLNSNGEKRQMLLDLIKEDLNIPYLDNECSHIVDKVLDEAYEVSFEEIIDATVNRVINIIESFEED